MISSEPGTSLAPYDPNPTWAVRLAAWVSADNRKGTAQPIHGFFPQPATGVRVLSMAA
jgi:hypothetical protein